MRFHCLESCATKFIIDMVNLLVVGRFDQITLVFTDKIFQNPSNKMQTFWDYKVFKSTIDTKIIYKELRLAPIMCDRLDQVVVLDITISGQFAI